MVTVLPLPYLTSHSGQLSLLPAARREISTSQRAVVLCGWRVRQDGSVHSWINVGLWVTGNTVWSGGRPNTFYAWAL